MPNLNQIADMGLFVVRPGRNFQKHVVNFNKMIAQSKQRTKSTFLKSWLDEQMK